MARVYLLKEEEQLIFLSAILLRHPSESQLMWIFMLVSAVFSPLSRDQRYSYTNGFVPSVVPKELGMPQAATVCTSIWKSQDFYVDTTKTLKSLSLTLPIFCPGDKLLKDLWFQSKQTYQVTHALATCSLV